MKKLSKHKYQAISLVIAIVIIWTSFFGQRTHLILASAILAVNAFMEWM